MPDEQLVGTPTEPKVLKWKWYPQEQFKKHRASAKGQTPAWMEDIANAPIIPCLYYHPFPKDVTYWKLGDSPLVAHPNECLVHRWRIGY
jgi:hypothetical protein